MQKPTFGSLFAGIGGFDLGFERAGFKCKWQVEIDDYATRVLEKHWPKVHRKRDIRQCGSSNLERVDCIIGGFPCQDISYAGRGAGLDGERSGLFFESVRLVRELQPRAVVWENVAALLTRGLDRVLGTLAEIGYDAQWHCIPAAAVGAPHTRWRIFIIAYTGRIGRDDYEPCKVLPQRKSKAFKAWEKANDRADYLRILGSEYSAITLAGNVRASDGVSSEVDRLRCLGNAIVPQVAEVVARMTRQQLDI